MKKVLLGILAVVVLTLLGVVVAALAQPDTLRLSRSVVIAAAPADVFPLANDFDQWSKWNPWQDLDPAQKTTFSDARSGVGAWYSWEGNDQVGKGKMTITTSEPNQKVGHHIEFIEPFASTADTELAFTPEGDNTKVTWSFESPNNFMGKVFGLFMDMEGLLGADFEKGLARLKPLAEAQAVARKDAEKAAAEAEAAATAQATATAEATTPTTP